MATEIAFHLIVPIVVGLIIGIIEAYFVYEDENMTSGRQFIGDMWHGLIFCVVGVFAASNVPWLLSQGFMPEWINGLLMVDVNGNSLIISIFIFLFMMVKMVASHAIKGISGPGFKEKMWHKLLIAGLVGFAPYWMGAVGVYIWLEGLQTTFPNLPL